MTKDDRAGEGGSGKKMTDDNNEAGGRGQKHWQHYKTLYLWKCSSESQTIPLRGTKFAPR